MAIIGIDLGTTNSLVTVWKDNKLQIIPNTFGKNLTPSIVSIDDNGTVYVGEVAKERLISDPENTVSSFKRFMGTDKRFYIGGSSFSAEELSALILQQLKADAEKYLNEPVTEAVISVPAYFNDDQRSATKNSGTIAGLIVERLVNEPSAAALAGSILFGKKDGLYLVVDLGGGTFDVSLVECFENVVSVISVSGDNHLGGIDFDDAIAKAFCDNNNINYEQLSAEAKGILLKSAEKCKIALSHQQQCAMVVDTENLKGSLTLNRKELVSFCGNLFARLKKPMLRVLVDGGFSINEVDETILVGGGSKISVVNQFVEHILGIKPLYIGDPDEIVARGVGIYAGIKERDEEIKQIVLTDICPFSLGVAVQNHNPNEANVDVFSPIIERNTVLPVSKKGFYSNVRPFQTFMEIKIFQGEEMYAKDNLYLGMLEVTLPKVENSSVVVTFTYDINGILEVEATVVETGETETITLLSESGKRLSEEELESKKSVLARLKKVSREDEQVQFMLSSLKALYAHAVGDTRVYIERQLAYFQNAINTQSKRKKADAMKTTWDFIQNVANSLSYELLGEKEPETLFWYEDYLNSEGEEE